MRPKKHPVPLAGGDRAGTSIAMQRRDTRNSAERQASARRLRRQQLARRLHRLGARVVFELLDEITRHHPAIADDLDQRLGRFAQLDPMVLAAVGGDRFAPAPTRLVGGGR